MRVLLVEDDPNVAAVLEQALRAEGETAIVERGGPAVVKIARSPAFDVIILDTALGGLDGFAMVHRLRQQGCQTPILMLADRDKDQDVVRSLNMGADDCIAKPVVVDVFLARVRALARRGVIPQAVVLRAANLAVNTATRKVVRGKRALALTKTEYALLELLLRNAGRIVTRDQIVETVWGVGSDIENSTLDTFVHLLRRKTDCPGEVRLIQTVRGVGYTIRKIKDGI